MSQTFAEGRRVGYARARLAILGLGLAILLLIAAIMLARGVVRDEVLGILLFVPIFVAFVFWSERGGVAAAAVATLAYGGLLYDSVQTVGFDRLLGQFTARTLGYFLFGIIGGWANRQLEGSLTKLELYDQIDDATGLFNARFFLQDTDLEMSRSKRYQSIFSISVVEIPAAVFQPLSRRQRAGVLRELGRVLRSSVRTVDRVVHGYDSEWHKVAIVLPETGSEGVRTFTERLAAKLQEFLQGRGVPMSGGKVQARSIVYPGDEDDLDRVRAEFMKFDQAQHPEDIEVARAPGTVRSSSDDGERRGT